MKSKIIIFLFLFLLVFIFGTYFLEQEKESTNVSSYSDFNYFEQNDADQNNLEKLDVSVFFCPEDDCKNKLLDLIYDSNKSIYCALYSLTDNDIYDAIRTKQKENLDIKIVTDLINTNRSTSKIGLLKADGVSIITNPEENKYMHNKYCVFDENVLLVGSANFTNDSFLSNNNILIIKDSELSKIFYDKINSYFQNNFSKDYLLIQNQIKNSQINFCPNDDCFDSVVKYLRESRESIYCMFYSYTLNDFSYELKRIKSIYPDIDIKIIIEKDLCSYPYCEYNSLLKDNIEIIFDENNNTMHNKFCVFDKKIVMTGSMNMSLNGIKNNEESLIFIEDNNLSQKYENYFFKYWFLWK